MNVVDVLCRLYNFHKTIKIIIWGIPKDGVHRQIVEHSIEYLI